MRSRVPSTLSRYGVTVRGNVTSVYPPLADEHQRGRVQGGVTVSTTAHSETPL
jgi:hypothetical protein